MYEQFIRAEFQVIIMVFDVLVKLSFLLFKLFVTLFTLTDDGRELKLLFKTCIIPFVLIINVI